MNNHDQEPNPLNTPPQEPFNNQPQEATPTPQYQPVVNEPQPQATQKPQYQAQPVQPDQPIQPAQPSSSLPGKTLGIVGFILAFIAGIIGLIISLVALLKSKKAGASNPLALAGVIVGVITTILSTILAINVAMAVVKVYEDCGASFLGVTSEQYECVTGGKNSSGGKFYTNNENDSSKYDFDPNMGPSTQKEEKSSGITTETYSTTRVNFVYPSTWVRTDKSNFSIIENGASSTDYQVFIHSKDGLDNVILRYTQSQSGTEGSYSIEQRRSLMQDSASKYTAVNGQSVTSAIGHGCAKNFAFTVAPKYIEKGQITGIQYEFTCTDRNNSNVQGMYLTTYDSNGYRHTLAGTALEDKWPTQGSNLKQVISSLEVY